MDFIKRCYTTRMKLWQHDDTTVRVRWYRADPGAKVYTDVTPLRSWSTWGSLTDTGYGDPWPLGEQLEASETAYDRGLNSSGFLGQHFDGPPSAWAEGGIHGVTPDIVTDINGGTPGCPWNGAPGPVVIATSIHGAGQVVAIGGPAILRVSDADPWNDDFFHHLLLWIRETGRSAPIASAGPREDWPNTFARPVISNIGSEHIDYDTEGKRVELRDKLDGISALWVGWNNADFSDSHQFLNPDIFDLIWQWVIDGGILILVNNTSEYDTEDPSPLNLVLEAVNTPMKFVHGDYGPNGYLKTKLTPDGTGEHPTFFSWQNRNNLLIGYPSYTWLTNTGFSSTLTISFSSPNLPETYLVRFEAYIWLWVNTAGSFSSVNVQWLPAGGTWVATVINGPFSTTPKRYHVLFPNTLLPGVGPYTGAGTQMFVDPIWSSGTPTIFVSYESATVTTCIDNTCDQSGLRTNRLNNLVANRRPTGGTSYLCGVQWERTCTVEGGDWAAAFAPQIKQQPCQSGVQVGGVAGQAGPYIQIAEGGISVGGSAGQGNNVQLGTGGVAVGGVALQFVPFVQEGTGGVAVGGDALQFEGFIQEGSGGLAVGGVAGQLLEPTLVGSGGVAVGGHAGQMIGPSQLGSGGVAVGGVASQG